MDQPSQTGQPAKSIFTIEDCHLERDLDRIQAILNDVIINSTALYDYEPRTRGAVAEWIRLKQIGRWPLRGAFNQAQELLAFATFGPFRPQPAYKYSVEHSIYVAQAARGQGMANALMSDLLEQAQKCDAHVLVGCIDADNAPSIALHQKFGFVHCGTVKQAGYKFGRWLDAAFYQKTLTTPSHPTDG
jgi:phosphinothricin acetyltransferase